MALYFRLIGPEKVGLVHRILRECGQDMKHRLGLRHWERTISLEDLRQSTLEREVYVVYDDQKVIATFTVGTEIPPQYRHTPALHTIWVTSTLQALYINRLAVLPAWQRQGIGRLCIQRIEELAVAYGCDAIRLDAYSRHSGLLDFYQKLGFQQVGRFWIGPKSFGARDVICLEKLREDFMPPTTGFRHN